MANTVTYSVSATATEFLGSLGVNSHLIWRYWGDGPYQNQNGIVQAIEYLGVQNIRDGQQGFSDASTAQTLAKLAGLGVSQTVVVAPPVKSWDLSLSAAISKLAAFEAAHPGYLNAIEGPNEIWNWPVSHAGLSGVAAAQAWQAELFAAVKANQVLRHVPVLDYTDLKSHGQADLTNVHWYGPLGQQPHILVEQMRDFFPQMQLGRPIAWTETGWASGNRVGMSVEHYPEGAEAVRYTSVDEATQARLVLNSFAAGFHAGFAETFIYELVNPFPARVDTDVLWNMGLFNADLTPKLAATAVHNLTGVLRANDAPSTLNASFKFALESADPLHFAQAAILDGNTLKVMLWRERDIWDEDAFQPIAHAAETMTVSLSGGTAISSVFNPIVSDHALVSDMESGFEVMLGDDMLVLQFDVRSLADAGEFTVSLSAPRPAPAAPEAAVPGPQLGATPAPVPAAAPVVAPTSPAEIAPQHGSEAIYRFFKPETGTHFYTASATERDVVQSTLADYRSEGTGFRSVAPQDGADAIYRFFKPETGTHFYTPSVVERDHVMQHEPQYRYEGVGFYGSDQAGLGLTEVFRFFKPEQGTHFYTASSLERDVVQSTLADYRFEGVAFYVPIADEYSLFG